MNPANRLESLEGNLERRIVKPVPVGRYQIYYKKQLITLTETKSYKSAALARSALKAKFYFLSAEVDQLLNDGTIEIKQVQ